MYSVSWTYSERYRLTATKSVLMTHLFFYWKVSLGQIGRAIVTIVGTMKALQPRDGFKTKITLFFVIFFEPDTWVMGGRDSSDQCHMFFMDDLFFFLRCSWDLTVKDSFSLYCWHAGAKEDNKLFGFLFSRKVVLLTR